MNFLRQVFVGVGVAAGLAFPVGLKAEVTNTNAPADFQEVYDLIRTHLAGESQAELDRAAVAGLLAELHSKVSLVGAPSSTKAETDGPMLAKSLSYDGAVGYLRVGRIAEGLAEQISAAFKELAGTNRLKGLVLDLRFAGGHDYAAAAAVADLFISKETPLLDWGTGLVGSKPKTEAITLPVAVLVNQKTAAAAEALAAVMRQSDRALILGANTAGEATMDQIYPLKNGQSLRIATAAIKLGNGETLSAGGLVPDIQVSVSPEDEKAYYADPFRELNKPSSLLAFVGGAPANANGATNRPARQRPTEADLIRERNLNPGREADYSVSIARDAEITKPVIRDPVLGRALDLLKVISVLPVAKPG